MTQTINGSGDYIIEHAGVEVTFFNDGAFAINKKNQQGDTLSKIAIQQDGAMELSTSSGYDIQVINTTHGNQVNVGGDGNINITVPEGKCINLNGAVNVNGSLNTN